MKNRSVILLLAIFMLTSSCGTAAAFKETRITTNTADQWGPSIWDKYIVWDDTRNGGNDIYLQNLATKVQTRVTKGVEAGNPYVSGNRIVWQDNHNGNWDIYMYEISTKKTTRITTNTADQMDPAVYGNYIVWVDKRNGYDDVYLQDLSTKKQTKITKDVYASCPGIYGNRIVWIESYDIYSYDLKTKKITKVLNGYEPQSLAIYGNKIIFYEMYEGVFYTTIYDLSAKKFTYFPNSFATHPAMYSNKIVYIDWSSNNLDIYMAQI